MKDCKLGLASIIKRDKFSRDQGLKNDIERESMKRISYKNVVSSLMYSTICTWPNKAFVATILRRYLANPNLGYSKESFEIIAYK